jgi:transposase
LAWKKVCALTSFLIPGYVIYNVTLDQIEDIELLRKAALLLQEDNKKLVRLIAKLKKELHALRGGDPEQLKLQIADLEQQLAKRNQLLFGDKSEKRSQEKPKAEKTPQTGHGPRPQPMLPEIEQVHLLDHADRVCSSCGGELEAWDGQHEASEEIDVVELKYVLKKHLRQKYRCRCGACIETAPGPVKLFAGARYSIDLALSVAIAKYADHLPLERQVKMMDRHGLITDSQTLWDQLNALAAVLEPTYAALSTHVLNQPVIGADETTWRLMGAVGKKNGGDAKKWQVWTAAAPDAVFYQIQDSRSTEAARNLLGDYAGTVVCDDYSAYKSLRKRGGRFQLAHCWAHVRRKFIEAEGEAPKECAEAIALIAELYAVEKRANAGHPEERARLRREESRAIVKRIEQWALGVRALPGSGLRGGIEYMGGMWENGLLRFLDDPNIPIDNNGTERCLRGVVIGRKNHYGSRSQRGTEVAALFYSLIESAKLAGVGPHTYLRVATLSALRGADVVLPHQLA